MTRTAICLKSLRVRVFLLCLLLNYVFLRFPEVASFQSAVLSPRKRSKARRWSPEGPSTSSCHHHKGIHSLLRWIPLREQQDFAEHNQENIKLSQKEDLEHFTLTYLAKLIQTKLAEGEVHRRNGTLVSSDNPSDNNTSAFFQYENYIDYDSIKVIPANPDFLDMVKSIVRGRFIDTTGTKNGEETLEQLFWKGALRPSQILGEDSMMKLESFLGKNVEIYIIKGAVMALQSLLILGMQLGVKGPPAKMKQWVSHLEPLLKKHSKDLITFKHNFFWINQENGTQTDWRTLSLFNQQLKYERDTEAGTQLLAYLLKKRTPQGAFDLLVSLGVWKKHEDLALLRSGFPTRFSEEEESLALAAEANNSSDIDTTLGLRRDLRHLKVYTIDSESTSEIDDGISLERYVSADGNNTDRLWIHIADVDRWAPRTSEIIKAAQRRSTTLYLPTGPIPMFPERLSSGCMSLRAGQDCYALSLGVELFPDGSINSSSIVVTPSIIHVHYRLSYDDVNEMLEEGVGFNEEWELGSMLCIAKKRKAHRFQNGATEGIITAQIPTYSATVTYDENDEDFIAISIDIQDGFNTGVNLTEVVKTLSSVSHLSSPVVSQSKLMVTEMMILAGEAIGKWAIVERERKVNNASAFDEVELKLPYRSQLSPDFRGRSTEVNTLNLLKENNAGYGYCAAWFFRRFLRPVRISTEPSIHKGMGLDCYVQWSSPIRRYADLQVHAAVKQYLRYNRVRDIVREGGRIHPEITSADIGAHIMNSRENVSQVINPIDFNEGSSFARASRPLSRSSHQYWLFEYVRTKMKQQRHGDPQLSFDCTVLGCVDESRHQYAIFIHELGLEHRYLSEKGRLTPGERIKLQVLSVNPRHGLMNLALESNFRKVSTLLI